MTPLGLLFERAGLPGFGLSAPLASAYGGDFGLAGSLTYANFVSSLDGVVALPAGGESGRIISGDSEPDRFVMALLRACADAVVIGAGNYRAAPGARWHAAHAYPALAEDFADLRRQLGLRPYPLLVVVTATGHLDLSQPAAEDALIVTTRAGQQRLAGGLPAGARLLVLDPEAVPLPALLATLRAEGLRRVLTEGGPTLLGELMKAHLVDELFLTVSPKLLGRRPDDGRKPLIDGALLDGRPLELLSARRHQSHLFLRYARR